MVSKLLKLARVRSTIFVIAAAGLVAIALGACNPDRVLSNRASRLSNALRSQSVVPVVTGSKRRRPAEDLMVRLANEIPGFAGAYLSSAHELVAYVRDTTAQHTLSANAATALRAHIVSDGFGLPIIDRPRSVRILAADYDFQTLSNYRDFLSDSALGKNGVNGVIAVGLDESTNRVRVETLASIPAATSEVTQALTRHNISVGAVRFEVSNGMHSATGIPMPV